LKGTSREQETIASILDIREQCKDKTVVIVGDLHGCFDELSDLLKRIGWTPETHVTILTGDLNDRGPRIKDTLLFAMNTQSVYTLMSNHEFKLLRYLRGNPVGLRSLSQTIQQCEDLLFDASFKKWMEALPFIVRWADYSYVVHAGIIPNIPIAQQTKHTCMYIRTWNPITKDISKEKTDQPWYKFEYCNRSKEPIIIYFGHQTREKDHWVSPWTLAMDGGVVLGGTLRACINGTQIVEVKARKNYYDYP
jgi:hypothetical protein